MNLETQLRPELWAAVAQSYESGNYTHAIKDAMAVMSEVLRDKSGLDGDGDKLVGEALGFSEGKQPRIKINKLQSRTEQDIQKGLLLVLKGMYALVRNPRTHERSNDDQKTADTLIMFVDYLLNFLGQSQQSFTVQDFLNMVTEPHFVRDKEYVVATVDRIPARKRGDTLIELYRNTEWKQSDNCRLVATEILKRLSDNEVDDFLAVLSEDLQKADNLTHPALVIKILPADLWPRIERMCRLRIENMFVKELDEAFWVPESRFTNSPHSTWIRGIAKYFLRKQPLRQVIVKKLRKEDFDQHNFVAQFFLKSGVLPGIFESEQQMLECIGAICDSVRSGNEFVKDCLVEYVREDVPPAWEHVLSEQLADWADPDSPELWLADGTPFLGKSLPQTNPANGQNEIPF